MRLQDTARIAVAATKVKPVSSVTICGYIVGVEIVAPVLGFVARRIDIHSMATEGANVEVFEISKVRINQYPVAGSYADHAGTVLHVFSRVAGQDVLCWIVRGVRLAAFED